jgi:hypothetical protein
MEVTTTQEVLLYDFNAIVSAIGGSLGLFLGFSCHQLALQALMFVIIYSLKWSATHFVKPHENSFNTPTLLGI